MFIPSACDGYALPKSGMSSASSKMAAMKVGKKQ